MKEKMRFVHPALRMLIALIAAAGFMAMNVGGGPLVLMDYIGGWETRRIYLAGCGAVIFAAFAVLALQKRSWAEYALMAAALFTGALMRFYMIDIVSPYYAENLAPVSYTHLRAHET